MDPLSIAVQAVVEWLTKLPPHQVQFTVRHVPVMPVTLAHAAATNGKAA